MVQQAAAQVLTPIYERKFHENSYGFRPGKSAQKAVLKAVEYMNEGYNWVVDIDLEKFFDTVEHDSCTGINTYI
jgi:RNA-directed DNA polymerase